MKNKNKKQRVLDDTQSHRIVFFNAPPATAPFLACQPFPKFSEPAREQGVALRRYVLEQKINATAAAATAAAEASAQEAHARARLASVTAPSPMPMCTRPPPPPMPTFAPPPPPPSRHATASISASSDEARERAPSSFVRIHSAAMSEFRAKVDSGDVKATLLAPHRSLFVTGAASASGCITTPTSSSTAGSASMAASRNQSPHSPLFAGIAVVKPRVTDNAALAAAVESMLLKMPRVQREFERCMDELSAFVASDADIYAVGVQEGASDVRLNDSCFFLFLLSIALFL